MDAAQIAEYAKRARAGLAQIRAHRAERCGVGDRGSGEWQVDGAGRAEGRGAEGERGAGKVVGRPKPEICSKTLRS